MPELPEVETFRTATESWSLHHELVGLTVIDGKAFEDSSDDPLQYFNFMFGGGQYIDAVKRRGKYMIIECTCGGAILIHFGMSGRMVLSDVDKLPKHTRAAFIIKKKFERKALCFVDPRHFGAIRLVVPIKYKAGYYILTQIGPEPLSYAFTAAYLMSKFSERKWKDKLIKKLLMDQSVIAGIGNIYAAEILFAAGVNPFRLCSDLSSTEVINIVKQTKEILKRAIKNKGTSFDHGYVGGQFQSLLNVYSRKKCSKCDTTISTSREIDGRNTFWCQICQK